MYNMDKKDKVKVSLDRDVVNKLIQMKKVGDTYTDIIKRLIKNATNTKN